MSRFYDDGGEGPPPEFWAHNLERALVSPRGKRALQGMIDALEAMPEHRLIRDYLVIPPEDVDLLWPKQDTDESETKPLVCGLGAYAAWQRMLKEGLTWEEAALAVHRKWGRDEEGDWTREVAKQDCGIAVTLGVHIAYLNDEGHSQAQTPEQLWQATYDWAKKMLEAPSNNDGW
jgi:hypothetical protein